MEISLIKQSIPIVEKLLRQEEESKRYQTTLETRIYDDSLAYQRLQAYCSKIERAMAGIQYQKSQVDFSLAHTAETCRTLAYDLSTERTKTRNLASQLQQLYPAIDAWVNDSLLKLPTTESAHSVDVEHLVAQNQQQKNLIQKLQNEAKAREDAIDQLKETLKHTEEELYVANCLQQLGSSDVEPMEEIDSPFSAQSSVDIVT
ncbi:hypothetical protein N7539_007698 [Penicillium diatomitis]|uniref:Uncharacterized protein n=1 Tax=Penicillium diatomitis TaxID=2819901 RepID=A0A9W9WU76_9EURO|nr:uncharacterized protein N7539_007698 [Penicillium diatomitis]KAJ5475411.1 hypothetical protein N7539_007698 [Penicillium diatomitis]